MIKQLKEEIDLLNQKNLVLAKNIELLKLELELLQLIDALEKKPEVYPQYPIYPTYPIYPVYPTYPIYPNTYPYITTTELLFEPGKVTGTAVEDPHPKYTAMCNDIKFDPKTQSSYTCKGAEYIHIGNLGEWVTFSTRNT